MNRHPTKEKIRNVLSVIAGIIIGVATIFLGTLVLALVMAHFSSDDVSFENTRLYKIFAVAIAITGFLITGYVTAKTAIQNAFILIFLTGIILLLTMLCIANFDWKEFSFVDWLELVLIIPCTLVGGRLAENRS